METTPVSSTSRTLKVRAAKSVDATASKSVKAVTVKRKPKAIVKPGVKLEAKPEVIAKPKIAQSAEPSALAQMVATAAYFIAQRRNFAPGNELGDWLTAEQQVLSAHSASN